MDYSESQSESSQNQSSDLNQLHNIWKKIKQTKGQVSDRKSLQSNHKSVGSVKRVIHQEQQKNLQTRLSLTQKQLSKARENTALLMKKLGQAEEKIQFLEFEVEKQAKQNQQKQLQISYLNSELLKNPKQETFARDNEQVTQYEQDIEQMSKKLQYKDRQIDRMTLKIKSLQMQHKNRAVDLKNMTEINEIYKKKVQDLEHVMNSVQVGQQSKGIELMELKDCKRTIQRLIILVKNTEQYRMFGQYADSCKDIHYLKNISKRMKSNQLKHSIPYNKTICSCMEIHIDQRLLWTPQTCYKIMLEMKLKYGDMSENCIEQALFQLNKIWSSKEENHVKKTKESYESEINRLKKKLDQRYDEMVARKQIERLKKQIQTLKINRKSAQPHSIDILKSIGQYEDELKLKIREVKLLQERIQLIENDKSAYDRFIYLEGALWILDKTMFQIQANSNAVTDYSNIFQQRLSLNCTSEEYISSFKEFFENITQLQVSLLEKLTSMRKSVLNKIGQRSQFHHTTMPQ